MGITSIMNSYIKTQCKNFMEIFFASNFLWTFKFVQKNCHNLSQKGVPRSDPFQKKLWWWGRHKEVNQSFTMA